MSVNLLSGYIRVLVGAVVLVFLFSSLSALVGSLYGDQAIRIEKRWLSGAVVTMDDWSRAHRFLDAARLMTQGSSDFTLAQARVSAWYPFVVNLKNDLAVGQVSLQGIELVRKDLLLRPYWGESATVLAILKARHDEVDQEFWRALDVFDRYARWEDLGMTNALEATLMVWDQLSSSEERWVVELFERSIHYRIKQAQSAFRLAESYNRLSELCAATHFSDQFPVYMKAKCGFE